GLEVAALGLGEDGAEGPGGLARSGDTGERDDPVARHVDVDIPEVVLVGAANADERIGRVVRGFGHRPSVSVASWGRGERAVPQRGMRRPALPSIRSMATKRKPTATSAADGAGA